MPAPYILSQGVYPNSPLRGTELTDLARVAGKVMSELRTAKYDNRANPHYSQTAVADALTLSQPAMSYLEAKNRLKDYSLPRFIQLCAYYDEDPVKILQDILDAYKDSKDPIPSYMLTESKEYEGDSYL